MAKSSAMPRAALGLRAHSGWAALVVVAGSIQKPSVVLRKRIETADPAIRGSKQPFHAAEPLPFSSAEALIRKCRDSTERLSFQALTAAIDDSRAQGYETVACGVVLGSGRALPELQKILASHALIHTAEGEFYRQALVEAGEHCGLETRGTKEGELFEDAVKRLKITRGELDRTIAELGRKIGPPWTEDQKYAALAGWLALANHTSER